jgi:hypothetical protein
MSAVPRIFGCPGFFEPQMFGCPTLATESRGGVSRVKDARVFCFISHARYLVFVDVPET